MASGSERNAPCPCGSGKKYKKCCGVTTVRTDESIEINRLIAYRGQIGRRRKQFCEEYLSTKKAVTQHIEQGLVRDATSLGKSISCRKGCSHCCTTYYIAASLQECETIVYWLYQHEDVMRRFLRTVENWKTQIEPAAECLDIIGRLYGKSIVSQITEEETRIFRTAMDDYESRNISCPFLIDGACSIYEVRPYVCASVVSISPAEWCHPAHPNRQQLSYLKTELPLSQDMPYFVRPSGSMIFANMPQLVHDLLNKGYATLASIPGLEALQQAVMGDSEVLAALRQSHT